MPNLVRVVHPQTSFAVLPIEQVAPDVGIASAGGEPIERAVVFQDTPEGEMHVYPLTDRAFDDLRRMLDGGIVVARSLPQPHHDYSDMGF